MRKKSSKILITLALLLVIVASITSGVFAIKIVIEESYNASSATNFYQINDTENYYETITFSNKNLNLLIRNNYSSVVGGNQDYFDLLIYTDPTIKVSTISTSFDTTSSIAVKQNGIDKSCHIFKEIKHSNLSATTIENARQNIDKQSTMNLQINFAESENGLEKTVDIVVLEHSDKNVYIDNFHQLKKLNSEKLFNTYYSNSFGDYELCAEGTYATAENNIAISSIGTVKHEGDIEVVNTLNGQFEITEGQIAKISFKTEVINFENGKKLLGGEQLTFEKTSDNYYINAVYGMKLWIDTESRSIKFYALPYTASKELQLMYFIGDVEIDKQFTLNIPAYINLLYSKITLYDNFSIEHHYGGAYAIDSINVNSPKIVKASGVLNDLEFNIITPNAYYSTASTSTLSGIEQIGVIGEGVSLNKSSVMVDFSDPNNNALLEKLMNDAVSFATNSIPKYIHNNCILPKQYHFYPITFTYDNHANFDNNGNVVRSENDVEVNEFTVKAQGKFGNVEKTVQTNTSFTIVGNSDQAEINFLATLISKSMQNVKENSGNFNAGANIGAIISNFMFDLNYNQPLTISLNANSQLNLVLQTLIDNKIVVNYLTSATIKLNENGDCILNPNGDKTKNIIIARKVNDNSSNTSSLSLKTSKIIIADNTKEQVNITNGVQSVTINIEVTSMPIEDRIKYLERYLTSIYLSDDNKGQNILTFANNVFYVGDTTQQENIVINSTLGVSEMNYNFYKITTDKYQKIMNGEISLDNLTEDLSFQLINEVFTIYNGIINVSAESLVLADGETIIAIADFTISGANKKIVREVKIPEKGIGSEDYSDYTNGDTFGEYFSGLDGNRLLYSIANDTSGANTAELFTSFHDAITLYMEIQNNNIASFCNLVNDAENNTYQINIDPTQVPTTDTVVSLSVKFFVGGDHLTGTEISSQIYNFIIPGIYRCGTKQNGGDIDSQFIYNKMLEVYKTDFVNLKGEQIYILSQELERNIQQFNLSNSGITEITSIRGLELLINTKEIILDGLNIESLAPFSNVDTTNLEQLSLKNTNITNHKIIAIEDGKNRASLYYLTALKKINLSGNNITQLYDNNGNSYLYRTVRDCDLSNNTNLSNLNGLSKLPFLTTVDLSNNKIAEFGELLKCKNLKTVDLFNNVPNEIITSSTEVTFGSNGSVNIPIYVALEGKGVSVINTASDTKIALYTDAEKIASYAINAVSYFEVQANDSESVRVIEIARFTTSDSTDATQTQIIIKDVFNNEYNKVTYVNSPSNDNINHQIQIADTTKTAINYKVIISVTVGTTTVYKQLDIMHRR